MELSNCDKTDKERLKDRYGEFENVFLKSEELKKLKERFGEKQTLNKIETLSQYLASKGKKYANHYATILAWDRKNPSPRPISEPIKKEPVPEWLVVGVKEGTI